MNFICMYISNSDLNVAHTWITLLAISHQCFNLYNWSENTSYKNSMLQWVSYHIHLIKHITLGLLPQ